MEKINKTSALVGRIAAGKADPTTHEEREIVAELRASYGVAKFLRVKR